MSFINVEHLIFSYKGSDEIILKDINFTAEKGEIITILGPSGCGKSTLLKLLAGLQSPTKGKVQMNGQDIKSSSLDRAFVFQNYGLFPWMKAGENIELALKQKFPNLSKAEVKGRTLHLLNQVGLSEDVAQKLPKELSGGMQQRCSIARALGIDSPVLLMDEPFGALDAITRAKLQDLLLDLMKEIEQEKTVFFVTHDVDEAILLGSRTIVLGQKPSSILYDVSVPYLKGEDRATLYEDPAILELRNQLLHYINLDISKRIDKEDQ